MSEPFQLNEGEVVNRCYDAKAQVGLPIDPPFVVPATGWYRVVQEPGSSPRMEPVSSHRVSEETGKEPE